LACEAEELIHSGIQEPILHLGQIHKRKFELYNSGQVHCTINSIDDMKEIEKYHSCTEPVKAHLKIDSGMGRMGVRFEETEFIMKALSDLSGIKVEAVYSHFSTAEKIDTEYRDWQLGRFREVVKLANDILPETSYFHIANSAGILNCTDSHFNMVRPGISLYGVSPLGLPHGDLKPVMKMKASVVMVKKMKVGESVGYNRLYTADQDENIALLQSDLQYKDDYSPQTRQLSFFSP
jgi:alanine racemase